MSAVLRHDGNKADFIELFILGPSLLDSLFNVTEMLKIVMQNAGNIHYFQENIIHVHEHYLR